MFFSRGGCSLQKRVLAGVVLLAVLLALIFAFYPGNSQGIELSTGAGISKMLRYENAKHIVAQNISNSAMLCSNTL